MNLQVEFLDMTLLRFESINVQISFNLYFSYNISDMYKYKLKEIWYIIWKIKILPNIINLDKF